MRRAIVAATGFCVFSSSAVAQETKPADPAAPLQLTTQQDHKLMMEALEDQDPSS